MKELFYYKAPRPKVYKLCIYVLILIKIIKNYVALTKQKKNTNDKTKFIFQQKYNKDVKLLFYSM